MLKEESAKISYELAEERKKTEKIQKKLIIQYLSLRKCLQKRR